MHIGQASSCVLNLSAVEYLVTFYCDRLKDRVTVLPQVLYGLQALVSVAMNNKP